MLFSMLILVLFTLFVEVVGIPFPFNQEGIGTVVALWLGIGATLPIDKSLTLGLF